MFTGIVEELGRVVRLEPTHIAVHGPRVTSGAHPGDSIAVSGVCLTVVDCRDGVFTADLMAETLQRTTLGALHPDSPVNLERAVGADGRFGGHIVQGHVEGIARLAEREGAGAFDLFRFTLDPSLTRYIAAKGSIAIDGVSLTVIDVGEDWLTVGLIPTTLQVTTLGGLRPGDRVNIETDIIARYVERLLGEVRP
jgi:riboflavin synthase